MRSRLFYAALLIFVAQLESGCQVHARYVYSKPRLDGVSLFRIAENDRLVSADIDLWLLSWNRQGSGLVILPVPFPIDVSDSPSSPFKVTLELKPKREGFSLNPGKVFLRKADDEVLTVKIGSGSQTEGKVIAAGTKMQIPLQAGVSTVLALEFDTNPPAPEDEFFLHIDGVSLHGSPYPIPRIRFAKGSWAGPLR